MFAGSPPFTKATAHDPYYKLIASNKVDIFWKFHSKHKGNTEFFSESFKFIKKIYIRNLVDSIFQLDASKRPTLQ